jgi:FtsP/CotA-like multicopper oxidase with cupredoxin domain
VTLGPVDTPGLRRTLPSALATAAVAALAFGISAVAFADRDAGHRDEHAAPPAAAAPSAPSADHGHAGHGAIGVAGGRSVADLTGPREGAADVRFALTARTAQLALDSGLRVDALTFDGTAPGPELRVRAGQLVEVVLRNADVAEGVTLHWHGLDVPNAEDGVAGVTQDAVPPGGDHVYRFRPDQVGTFWYHSHQDSARTVHRGLYGALVVEPAAGAPLPEAVLLGHSWLRPGTEPVLAIGTGDGRVRRDVPAGTRMRARLVNTDSLRQTWTVAGTPFTVAAIDGTDVHGPSPLDGERLRIPAGGRVDVEFTAPATVALLDGAGPAVGFGTEPVQPPADGPVFDPLAYGAPGPLPFPVSGPFDRELEQVLDTVRTLRRGIPDVAWTINGERHPAPAVVTEGELVRVRIRNDGDDAHPMHLHGHHVLVLSRDGVPATGSPWWADTVEVEPGEEFEVAFRADNPGVWMDHCHNLAHAAAGMVLHLSYEGVSTPFSAGTGAGNTPE